jgi:hypothetical protein
MSKIKRFNEILIEESVRILSPEEIEDCILDYTDTGEVNVKSLDQHTIRDVRKNYPYSNKKLVYKNSESIDKYLRDQVKYTDFDSSRTVSLLIEIPHPRRIKGNLDLDGYTFDTIKYVFRRFIEFTKVDYLVDIWIEILQTNVYDEPLAEVIVNVTFPRKKINEQVSNSDWELDELSDIFVEFEYYEKHEIPINLEFKKLKEEDGYKYLTVKISHDLYDKLFVENTIDQQLGLLKSRGYKLYRRITKNSGRSRAKDIPVYGEDRTSRVYDPILDTYLYLKKKIGKINESFEQKEGDILIIVDVQRSFSRFFTPNYLHQLKEYCKNFSEVYQIFDNHVDGKNVDKDYLYDDDHEVSVHDDLYWFPNQVDIIEKRYNYDVNVDFYKKILDKETYKRAKQLEYSSKLKPGDMFETKGGTVITYIGNNHKWFHLPKKLYDLFKGLKGRKVIIVGGASSECLQDVFITATSLGVDITQRHKYIYSASHCPL